MTDFERNKARVTAEYEALINRKTLCPTATTEFMTDTFTLF